MYLVGFIIRIYHDARSSERQIHLRTLPPERHNDRKASKLPKGCVWKSSRIRYSPNNNNNNNNNNNI